MANKVSPKYAPVAVPVYENDNDASGVAASSLGERFVAHTSDAISQGAEPYLEVTAPSTLPQGYTFEVESNGHNFTVKVPVGGVEEGQKFSVPFPAGANGYSGSAIPRASVPVGNWKDGLCDCFRHGVCHPHLWNAYCCPLVAMGQIMQRLKLTWYGDSGSVAQTAGTFRTLFWITVTYIVFRSMIFFSLMSLVQSQSEPTSYGGNSSTNNDGAMAAVLVLNKLVAYSYVIFLVYIIARTRHTIRNKYSVPMRHCSAGEDCCCAFWCTCCTIAQMARHTADYDNHAARCCSETGLGPNAPSIV